MGGIGRRALLLAGGLALAGLAPAMAQSQAPASAPGYETRMNVEYGRHDGVALLGDFYAPRVAANSAAKSAVVIAVHVGGWQGGSKEAYKYWGPWLAQRGYALFSIDYRLIKAGQKMFPESLQDLRAAIQYVRSHAAELKIDGERIALMGDSAGGHLVSLIALGGEDPALASAYKDDPYAGVSARVKAVISAYGVYDMVQQWNHDVLNRPRDNIAERYLGAAPIDNRRLYFDASPQSYAIRTNNAASFLIANGTEDDVVDRAQADAFLLALKQAGIYARRIVAQGAGHYWNTDPIDEPGGTAGFFAPRVLRFLAERL
jgi:acetyl esterase/lipase